MLECFAGNNLFVICSIVMLIWIISIPILTGMQYIYKWIDDDSSVVYNIILRYIMVDVLGYEIRYDGIPPMGTCYLYSRDDGNWETRSNGLIAYAFGVLVIFSTSVLLYFLIEFPLMSFISLVVVGSIPACRFVVRLNKKVNKLGKL